MVTWMGVNSYTIDLVFTGQMQSVQFLIFSQKYEDVANSITRDLRRGVTVVDCQGWYTGEARKMLIVVARKSEMQNIMRVTKMVLDDEYRYGSLWSGIRYAENLTIRL